ncbi:unnamed protein product [Arabidopsis thaliana]|uniref:RNase H type-1 domain-containing protein n=1 Tax=Arabidopsis thaliana TaxID=3702 RepID=A0A654EX52_ARATH|nr:unnamed protein product [Arabidopsis thaliana]
MLVMIIMINQSPKQRIKKEPVNTTSLEVPSSNSTLYCYVDASWIDENSKAGISWILTEVHGRCLLKSSSSIEPIDSVIETEDKASVEAVGQLKRLNYRQVTFCGDSIHLYQYLEKAKKQGHSSLGQAEIQSYLEDIKALAPSYFRFKFIGRNANHLADALAKEARLKESLCMNDCTELFLMFYLEKSR